MNTSSSPSAAGGNPPVLRERRACIRVDAAAGLARVVLDNGELRVTVLPELGAKISSLISVASGREFLLQPPERPYAKAAYGDLFEASDTSGFDECFPTIAACKYPVAPFSGTMLPDHGELWSVPWRYEVKQDRLVLGAAGVRLPYVLRKAISLDGAAMEVAYELQSVSDSPLRYLWSAHPLLAAEPGATIMLPSAVASVRVHSSAGNRLGEPGQSLNWPTATVHGTLVALDKMVGPKEGTAVKLFTPRLVEGWCGLRFPRSGEAILFRFDPAAVPYVGIWNCQGAWPRDRSGHFTVGLEPCNAATDALDQAIEANDCPILPPHGTHAWSLRIEVQSGAAKVRS